MFQLGCDSFHAVKQFPHLEIIQNNQSALPITFRVPKGHYARAIADADYIAWHCMFPAQIARSVTGCFAR
jgi:hypothetical protein